MILIHGRPLKVKPNSTKLTAEFLKGPPGGRMVEKNIYLGPKCAITHLCCQINKLGAMGHPTCFSSFLHLEVDIGGFN